MTPSALIEHCPVCGKQYVGTYTLPLVLGENLRHNQERIEDASICHSCHDWAHLQTFALIVASGKIWGGEVAHV